MQHYAIDFDLGVCWNTPDDDLGRVTDNLYNGCIVNVDTHVTVTVFLNGIVVADVTVLKDAQNVPAISSLVDKEMTLGAFVEMVNGMARSGEIGTADKDNHRDDVDCDVGMGSNPLFDTMGHIG